MVIHLLVQECKLVTVCFISKKVITENHTSAEIANERLLQVRIHSISLNVYVIELDIYIWFTEVCITQTHILEKVSFAPW